VTLVELHEWWRRRLGYGRESSAEASDRWRKGDASPAAAGADRTDAGRACLEPASALECELHWASLGDLAATSELVADRGHDRHRQVRGPTEGTHGDRFEPAQRRQNAFDTARSFGETNCVRHAVDDWVSQRRGGCR
jgi:hypothetical protein